MANNQDDVHSNTGYISEKEDDSDNDGQEEGQSKAVKKSLAAAVKKNPLVAVMPAVVKMT